ncbi:pantoate--beta-alanine ligase [soil metagenome]
MSLEVYERVAEARAGAAAAREAAASSALVPTMGALHEGHLSLVDRAREVADRVVLSIFVNPLQFGAGEDLVGYPRQLQEDVDLARGRGVDAVFAPSAAEMYPAGEPVVTVDPGPLAERLCGASRPGHFRGVLTVVAKLFGICQPDVAVFGSKDFQQAVLVRRMAQDLNLPVRVVSAPIVRDEDGLALSSRNRYLSGEQRVRARSLSRALREAQRRFGAGERDAAALRDAMSAVLAQGGTEAEYAEVVDRDTLDAVSYAAGDSVCLVAGRVDGVRLIDNSALGETIVSPT